MAKSKVQKISLDTDITRYGLLIVGVVCLGIIFFSIFMIYISTPPERIYAARVNGNPITLDEYNKSVERMKNQYGQMLKVDFNSPQGQTMLDGIKKNMLDGLVVKEVIFEAAKKMNVSVTSTEVEEEIDAIKKKSFSGDDKLFNDTLRLNRTTLGQLRESVAKDKTVEKVKKAVIDERVKISDKDKQAYYDKNKKDFTVSEEVKASHILVKDQKLADSIYDQLQKGGKFEELAKKNSTDPGSKDKGGDLGSFGKGKMVPEFEKAVFAMKIGEISKPVKSSFGYHIIKKTGQTPAKESTFAEVKTKVADKIKETKGNAELEKFIKEEKAKSEIKLYVVSPGLVVNTPPSPTATKVEVNNKPTDKKVEVKTTNDKAVETKKDESKDGKPKAVTSVTPSNIVASPDKK